VNAGNPIRQLIMAEPKNFMPPIRKRTTDNSRYRNHPLLKGVELHLVNGVIEFGEGEDIVDFQGELAHITSAECTGPVANFKVNSPVPGLLLPYTGSVPFFIWELFCFFGQFFLRLAWFFSLEGQA
jgi:hypothetical protein